ncbi:MAG: shikimate kinase [Candidatus Humimicrobiaceae bacterium]
MYLKNISLIGFMGSGKSTIGKIVAENLNYLFVDVDKIIEYVYGLSISEIFKRFGETRFREIENEIIGKIYHNKSCVFACGGGSFCKEGNIEIIRRTSFVVYLAMTEEEAYERLKYSKNRPLLLVEEDLRQRIKNIMDQRLDIYNKNCDLKIDIDKKSPIKIKDEIISYINLH